MGFGNDSRPLAAVHPRPSAATRGRAERLVTALSCSLLWYGYAQRLHGAHPLATPHILPRTRCRNTRQACLTPLQDRQAPPSLAAATASALTALRSTRPGRIGPRGCMSSHLQPCELQQAGASLRTPRQADSNLNAQCARALRGRAEVLAHTPACGRLPQPRCARRHAVQARASWWYSFRGAPPLCDPRPRARRWGARAITAGHKPGRVPQPGPPTCSTDVTVVSKPSSLIHVATCRSPPSTSACSFSSVAR